MNTGKSKEFMIDFEKAAGLANADLYFRMMVALNDLSSVQQLSALISTSDYGDHTKNGLDSYTNRLVQSHVAEAIHSSKKFDLGKDRRRRIITSLSRMIQQLLLHSMNLLKRLMS